MARYIEEEAFVNFVQEHFCNGCNNYNGVKCRSCSVDDAISFVESAPTADVVPKSEVEILKVRLEMAEEAYKGLSELYHTDTDALVEARRKTEVEVAREIFEEIETLFGAATEVTIIAQVIETSEYKALKKKYLPDTNVGNITAAEAIAKLIFDNYTMSHDLKTAVKLIEGWQEEFGKLKDAKIIEGLQPIESMTSVHMLALERYKDTNDANKVSSGDICVVCGEIVPEGRQVCGMCETGQEFLKKRKE